jgi:hypothetical protein
MGFNSAFKGLNAELNPIFHLLALLGGATIVDVSRLRVKGLKVCTAFSCSFENCQIRISATCL